MIFFKKNVLTTAVFPAMTLMVSMGFTNSTHLYLLGVAFLFNLCRRAQFR